MNANLIQRAPQQDLILIILLAIAKAQILVYFTLRGVISEFLIHYAIWILFELQENF